MLYAPTVAQLLVCRLTRHFPLILFAAVAVAGLAMARFAYVASEDAARIRFEAAADEALNRIESRIELHLGLLHVTHAFFAAYPDEVSRGEFHAFFEALQVEKNYGGLRGLGLLAVGRAGEEEELARVIAAYHGQEARIHPPSGEEWVTPVLIYEPVDASSRIGIGFNMYTDPARREAIRTAWQAGEPRASGRVSFDEKQAGQPGVLVFLRLDGAGPDPGAGGRRGGLLFEVLRIEDLFRVALDKFPSCPCRLLCSTEIRRRTTFCSGPRRCPTPRSLRSLRSRVRCRLPGGSGPSNSALLHPSRRLRRLPFR